MATELNLFQTDRTTRQKYCLKTWIKSKLHSTIEAATGFGKTNIALMAIELLKKKIPNLHCIIVVPTETLKDQWEEKLVERDLVFNCEVFIVNTLIKTSWTTDLLVLDKVLLSINLFNCWKLLRANYSIIILKINQIGQSAAKFLNKYGKRFIDYPEMEYKFFIKILM